MHPNMVACIARMNSHPRFDKAGYCRVTCHNVRSQLDVRTGPKQLSAKLAGNVDWALAPFDNIPGHGPTVGCGESSFACTASLGVDRYTCSGTAGHAS
jgi:hypothetical protein